MREVIPKSPPTIVQQQLLELYRFVDWANSEYVGVPETAALTDVEKDYYLKLAHVALDVQANIKRIHRALS